MNTAWDYIIVTFLVILVAGGYAAWNSTPQSAAELEDELYSNVYRGKDGAMWIRPRDEFEERFNEKP